MDSVKNFLNGIYDDDLHRYLKFSTYNNQGNPALKYLGLAFWLVFIFPFVTLYKGLKAAFTKGEAKQKTTSTFTFGLFILGLIFVIIGIALVTSSTKETWRNVNIAIALFSIGGMMMFITADDLSKDGPYANIFKFLLSLSFFIGLTTIASLTSVGNNTISKNLTTTIAISVWFGATLFILVSKPSVVSASLKTDLGDAEEILKSFIGNTFFLPIYWFHYIFYKEYGVDKTIARILGKKGEETSIKERKTIPETIKGIIPKKLLGKLDRREETVGLFGSEFFTYNTKQEFYTEEKKFSKEVIMSTVLLLILFVVPIFICAGYNKSINDDNYLRALPINTTIVLGTILILHTSFRPLDQKPSKKDLLSTAKID